MKSTQLILGLITLLFLLGCQPQEKNKLFQILQMKPQ